MQPRGGGGVAPIVPSYASRGPAIGPVPAWPRPRHQPLGPIAQDDEGEDDVQDIQCIPLQCPLADGGEPLDLSAEGAVVEIPAPPEATDGPRQRTVVWVSNAAGAAPTRARRRSSTAGPGPGVHVAVRYGGPKAPNGGQALAASLADPKDALLHRFQACPLLPPPQRPSLCTQTPPAPHTHTSTPAGAAWACRH